MPGRPRITISIKKFITRIGALLFALIALVLVIASPFGLKWFAERPNVDWASLSNVGQTYGAISALLSTLALGGVVASLLYQARDLKTSREQASRSTHQDLLRMELEDPFFLEILGLSWGKQLGLKDHDAMRRNLFIHLWVSFWEGQYVLGDMPESSVRYAVVSELFGSPYGRLYWSISRDAKLATNTGRRLKFNKIVDEEYVKIVDNKHPFPVEISETNEKNTRRKSSSKEIILLAVAAGGAVVADRLFGRYVFRKS